MIAPHQTEQFGHVILLNLTILLIKDSHIPISWMRKLSLDSMDSIA